MFTVGCEEGSVGVEVVMLNYFYDDKLLYYLPHRKLWLNECWHFFTAGTWALHATQHGTNLGHATTRHIWASIPTPRGSHLVVVRSHVVVWRWVVRVVSSVHVELGSIEPCSGTIVLTILTLLGAAHALHTTVHPIHAVHVVRWHIRRHAVAHVVLVLSTALLVAALLVAALLVAWLVARRSSVTTALVLIHIHWSSILRSRLLLCVLLLLLHILGLELATTTIIVASRPWVGAKRVRVSHGFLVERLGMGVVVLLLLLLLTLHVVGLGSRLKSATTKVHIVAAHASHVGLLLSGVHPHLRRMLRLLLLLVVVVVVVMLLLLWLLHLLLRDLLHLGRNSRCV